MKILKGGVNPVVQTKGDANNYPDPWTARLEGATAWREVAVAPKLGYVISALRSPTVRTAAVLIAPLFLLLLALAEIWGKDAARKRVATSQDAPSPAQSAPVAPGGDSGERRARERRLLVGPYSGPERRRGRDRRASLRGYVPLPPPAAILHARSVGA